MMTSWLLNAIMLLRINFLACKLFILFYVYVGFRDKKTPMDLVVRALNIFLQTKRSLNESHEFALMFLDNCAKWVSALLSVFMK